MRRFLVFLVTFAFPAFASAQQGYDWPDVSGSWAQKQVTTSVSKIPIIGKIETRTTAYLLLDVEQSGSSLTISSKVCKIDIDGEFDKVRSIVPQAMVDAIGTTKRRARLERMNDGGVRFFQPKSTDLLGVKLASPKEDLPKDEGDDRVVDADDDGKPGVTVRIEGLIDGAVYVIQRSWSILRGEATDRRIDGKITWKTEQVVLDATSSLLNSNPNARPHVDRDRHYFRTTRVGSQTDCRSILSSRKKLFAR